MQEYEFDAPILKVDGIDAAFVEFPFDVEAEFGTRGQVKVKALFDGAVSYRGSLVKMGHHCHILGLTKEIRAALGKQPGDIVHVLIQKDTEPRLVEVPADFQDLLDRHPEEKAFFEALSYTNRKAYVQWVSEAKREETRKARLERSLALLAQKVRRP